MSCTTASENKLRGMNLRAVDLVRLYAGRRTSMRQTLHSTRVGTLQHATLTSANSSTRNRLPSPQMWLLGGAHPFPILHYYESEKQYHEPNTVLKLVPSASSTSRSACSSLRTHSFLAEDASSALLRTGRPPQKKFVNFSPIFLPHPPHQK